MSGAKKKIKLVEIKTLMGNPFRETEWDEDGNAILELRRDSEKNPIKQVPRDAKNEAIPGAMPENVYMARSKAVKNALPVLLKRFYLNIPQNRLTRQDTIYGTRMYQNIADSQDGYIELDDDIHKWIREKLLEKSKNSDGVEQELGILIFGTNLTVFEDALDAFDRLHEPQEKSKEKGKGEAETKEE